MEELHMRNISVILALKIGIWQMKRLEILRSMLVLSIWA